MGLSTSAPLTRAVAFVDLEGGVKSVPIWDAAFVSEHTAMRMYAPHTKRQQSAIRRSLGRGEEKKHLVSQANMHAALADHVRASGPLTVVAWSSQEQRVLRRALPDDAFAQLSFVDPLPWVRRTFKCSNNSLSYQGKDPDALLPRLGVVNAHPHTALSDARALRDVCLAAMRRHHGEPKMSYAKCVDALLECVCTPAWTLVPAPKDSVQMLDDDDVWEENGRIKASRRAEFRACIAPLLSSAGRRRTANMHKRSSFARLLSEEGVLKGASGAA